jgi:AhpD family alkylhydroperoxidase
VRLILKLQQRKYGRALEPALLWGRMPRAFLMLTLLYRSIDRATSPLEPELRSLTQVRISQLNGCAFCVDLNSAAALERHSTPEKLAAIADHASSPLFAERERVALAYTEAITDSARCVDDTLFSRLQHHFTDQEIVELTALIAFQNLSSRFNAALGVPAQGFCEGSPRASSRATKPGRRGSA